jgi:hypothetical protein
MVGVQQIAPSLITQLLGARGRAYDVCEQTVVSTRSASTTVLDPVRNSSIRPAIFERFRR